ncbi:MAG TPA: SWIM zinc finger family protein [Ktedonobacterales bacterium]
MPAISAEQVLALTPDTASAQAGRKLAAPRHWKSVGRDDAGLWGECLGSALYQVKIDLANLTVACSCPSRKFPCKHGIGLLLLAADDTVPTTQPPEWMSGWLTKRAAKAALKAAAPNTDTPVQPADATDDAPARAAADKVASRRIEKRQRLMAGGFDNLDLWLSDLMRNGIAGLEVKGASFWEAQAARMVDAQVPGAANRLRRMAGIPGSAADWPERLLAELGKLALLSQAWRCLDSLSPALRETVRQVAGWALSAEEVDARGELVSDGWLVLGQWVDDSERIHVQRTWLLGERSQRPAVIMQYSPSFGTFAEVYLPGSSLTADLRYWPGAYPLRAKIVTSGQADKSAATGPAAAKPAFANWDPASYTRVEGLLQAYAGGLACDPWLGRLGGVLRGVTPTLTPEGDWRLLDADGDALPLVAREHWRLLAVSGGQPVDVMVEWNGETLLPLGVIAVGTYTPLTEARA